MTYKKARTISLTAIRALLKRGDFNATTQGISHNYRTSKKEVSNFSQMISAIKKSNNQGHTEGKPATYISAQKTTKVFSLSP